MRLYSNQLNSHLKKSLLPYYLLSAEEPLVAQECRDAIIATAKKRGFSDRDILHVESGFDWNLFYEATANLSLFGERKIVDLRFPTEKVDAKASKALVNFFDNSNPDTQLIITLPKVSSALQRSPWFKTLDSNGAWLPIKPLTGRHFLDWIMERSRQLGLNCSPGAIKLIAERVEGNLLAAAQELEKLSLLLPNPGEAITEKQVQATVASSARYDLFKWVDTLLIGNTTKSLNMLHGLRAEGSEPILLLWALNRELRIIIRISELKQSGHTLGDAMQQQKVWKNRQAIISKALSRHNNQTLYQLLEQNHQADLAIKGLSKDCVWRILEEMVVRFCEPKIELQLQKA